MRSRDDAHLTIQIVVMPSALAGRMSRSKEISHKDDIGAGRFEGHRTPVEKSRQDPGVFFRVLTRDGIENHGQKRFKAGLFAQRFTTFP